MLHREIIAVCSVIHTKHINTLCGLNVESLNAKPGGAHSNQWAVKIILYYVWVCESQAYWNTHTSIYVQLLPYLLVYSPIPYVHANFIFVWAHFCLFINLLFTHSSIPLFLYLWTRTPSVQQQPTSASNSPCTRYALSSTRCRTNYTNNRDWHTSL
jgi:hypothetical protein